MDIPSSERATSLLLVPQQDASRFRNDGSKEGARLRRRWRRKARHKCWEDGTMRCVLRSPDGHNLETVEFK